jgi:internalin A
MRRVLGVLLLGAGLGCGGRLVSHMDTGAGGGRPPPPSGGVGTAGAGGLGGAGSGGSTAGIPCTGNLSFADPTLEAAVRQALSMPIGSTAPIPAAQAASIARLTALPNISDLSGIECLFGLTDLTLAGNRLMDLGPLAYLLNLRTLSLADNPTLRDLGPLAKLSRLESLDLSAVQNGNVQDIAPLAGLTNLRTLNLAVNLVGDLGPLASLRSLEDLTLGHNLITDLSPIASLENLRRVDMSSNRVADLTPLATMVNLQELHADDNRIGDLGPLSALWSLGILSLARNDIEQVTGLALLTTLTDIALDGNQIHDLSALGGLYQLDHLSLGQNAIEDLSPLASLYRLESLSLQDNRISDPSPIQELPSLLELDLDDNLMSELNGFQGLTRLVELHVSGNHATYLGGVVTPVLESLYIARNPDLDLSSLSSSDTLITLDISDDSVPDPNFLRFMSALQTLTVSRSGISDAVSLARALADVPLETLRADGNQMTTLAPFVGGPADLVLAGNRISDLSPLLMFPARARTIDLTGNPIDCAAQAPTIQAAGARKFVLTTDCGP